MAQWPLGYNLHQEAFFHLASKRARYAVLSSRAWARTARAAVNRNSGSELMGPLGPNLRKGVSTSSWTGSVAAPALDPVTASLQSPFALFTASGLPVAARPPAPPATCARHPPRPRPAAGAALEWKAQKHELLLPC